MSSKYVDLEPNIVSELAPGEKLSFDASQPVSLFTTTSFLYTTAIMLIVGVAATRYMLAGIWRIEASERGVRKSNEEIKRVTLGLLGVLSLFVILYTFNKDLLTGEVGLDGLKSTAGSLPVTSVPRGTSVSGTPATCQSPDDVKAKLTSQGGLCGGATCSALSGCNYQQFLPIITSEAARQGVNPKLVVAIICKENRGMKIDAENRNTDSTGRTSYDCGLMQVNQNTPCTEASYDPATNIAAGVRKIKEATGQVYTGIPQVASIAAAYNSGPGHNNASADCTTSSGFPFSIPKWACPINPGNSTFNMCSVKSYACDVSACVDQLSGVNL